LRLASAGRVEARIALNLVSNAKAEALADAGVSRAAYSLLQEEGWALDGTPYEVRLPGGSATIELRDENGKINPNLAPEKLTGALLMAAGVPGEQAQHLAAAIADWVSPGTVARPFGAKAAEYSSAGLAYGPPGAPIESVGELARVLGMTPEILVALRPYLSTFSRVAIPDPRYASAAVQSAIELYRASAGGTSLMPGLAATSVVAVSVIARTGNAVFVREAVLKLDPQAPAGYVVLDWRRGDLPER
jgi:general secretion pathway protein K